MRFSVIEVMVYHGGSTSHPERDLVGVRKKIKLWANITNAKYVSDVTYVHILSNCNRLKFLCTLCN